MSADDLKPWKNLEAVDVARVAAALMGGLMGAANAKRVADATRTAMQLLEAAQYGLQGIYESRTLTDGVDRWDTQQASRAELWKAVDAMPPDWPDANAQTIPFDRATELLLPRHKKTDRLPIFRRWLAQVFTMNAIEAGEKVAAFKEHGIPRNCFQWARMTLADWQREQTSKKRGEAGRKGGKAKARRTAGK